ncbi:hypothetical protein [Acidithiobacillus sp.]|uniref:hypothetical protein n=1 Tax=Acidithiobacillus sp. TaxID=1872118 RepID=UPI003CFC740F
MTSPIDMKELASTLGISVQSLELRMQRLIPKVDGMDTSNATGGINLMDIAEAKLLGLLDLSTEERCILMHELGMIQA